MLQVSAEVETVVLDLLQQRCPDFTTLGFQLHRTHIYFKQFIEDSWEFVRYFVNRAYIDEQFSKRDIYYQELLQYYIFLTSPNQFIIYMDEDSKQQHIIHERQNMPPQLYEKLKSVKSSIFNQNGSSPQDCNSSENIPEKPSVQKQGQDLFQGKDSFIKEALKYSNDLAGKCIRIKAHQIQIENKQYQYYLGVFDKIQIFIILLKSIEKVLYKSNQFCSIFLMLNLEERMIKHHQSSWRVDFENELLALQVKDIKYKEVDQNVQGLIQLIAYQRMKGRQINSKFSQKLRGLIQPVAYFVEWLKITFNKYSQQQVKQKSLSLLPLMIQHNNYITLRKIKQFLNKFIEKHQLNDLDQFDFSKDSKAIFSQLKNKVSGLVTLLFLPRFNPQDQSQSSHFFLPQTHFRQIICHFQALFQKFSPEWNAQEREIRKKINLGTLSENQREQFHFLKQRRQNQAKLAQQKKKQETIQHVIRCERSFNNFLDKQAHNKKVILKMYYSPLGIQDLDLRFYILKQIELNSLQTTTRSMFDIFLQRSLPHMQRFVIGQNGHQFDLWFVQKLFEQIVDLSKLNYFSIMNATTYENHKNKWFNFRPAEDNFKKYSKNRYQRNIINYMNSNPELQYLQVPTNSSRILKYFAQQVIKRSKKITLVLGYPYPYTIYPLDPDLLTNFSAHNKHIINISITNVSFGAPNCILKLNRFLQSVAQHLKSFKLIDCHNFEIHHIFPSLGNCTSLIELRLQRTGLICPLNIQTFLLILSRLKLQYFSIQLLLSKNIHFSQQFLQRLIIFQCQNQQQFDGSYLSQLQNAESINISGCDKIKNINFLYGLNKLKYVNLSFLSWFSSRFWQIQSFFTETLAQQIQQLALLGYGDNHFQYQRFSKIKKLKSLAIDSLGKDVDLKRFLTHFSSLEKLTISYYYHEVQADLKSLFNLINVNPMDYPQKLRNRSIQLYHK